MGKFEFYASIPGDSTCANSENFNLGLKIWENWEYLNSSCNSCKVISVSISYRVLIKDQMFTHIEFNWVWEEVKSYSAINQNQTNTMQFRTSLRHWQVKVHNWGRTHSRQFNKKLTINPPSYSNFQTHLLWTQTKVSILSFVVVSCVSAGDYSSSLYLLQSGRFSDTVSRLNKVVCQIHIQHFRRSSARDNVGQNLNILRALDEYTKYV